jgi:hypothetical protein
MELAEDRVQWRALVNHPADRRKRPRASRPTAVFWVAYTSAASLFVVIGLGVYLLQI